jgi:hypothetical protein
VAGSIDRRIEALEAIHARGSCEACGDEAGATWEVVWVDPEEPAESKWCSTCNRPLEIVITWGDIPEEAEERIRWAERG